MSGSVPVWDLPVRLFHWSTVLLLAALVASGELGAMAPHALAGEALLALVLVRLAWGVVGSPTARFAAFVAGPAAVRDYLRRGMPPTLGHNPLGGWMILALLATLLVQAGLGLMANDDVGFDGPLVSLVGSHVSALATRVHHRLFAVLAVLAAVHVAAVLLHWAVRRENLIAPMITGRKRRPSGV